jgi:hypothetical protein
MKTESSSCRWVLGVSKSWLWGSGEFDDWCRPFFLGKSIGMGKGWDGME